MRWSKLCQRKKRWQWARASSAEPNRPGIVPAALECLELALRERVLVRSPRTGVLLVTPASASGCATGSHAMKVPRSA